MKDFEKQKIIKQKMFLLKLANLMKEYNASFEYTVDDDGIHIYVNDEEIYKGFLSNQNIDDIINFATK